MGIISNHDCKILGFRWALTRQVRWTVLRFCFEFSPLVPHLNPPLLKYVYTHLKQKKYQKMFNFFS